VRSPWLGSVGQWEGLERQVEIADDRVVDELDAGAVGLDVRGGPSDTNASRRDWEYITPYVAAVPRRQLHDWAAGTG
jgi:hypothetical protein